MKNSIFQLNLSKFSVLSYLLNNISNAKTAFGDKNISKTRLNNKIICEIIDASKNELTIKISG